MIDGALHGKGWREGGIGWRGRGGALFAAAPGAGGGLVRGEAMCPGPRPADCAVSDQSVLDVRGDGDEGLLDVDILLRRGLEKVNVVLLRQRFSLLICDGLKTQKETLRHHHNETIAAARTL
jgi:hypothetical protein